MVILNRLDPKMGICREPQSGSARPWCLVILITTASLAGTLAAQGFDQNHALYSRLLAAHVHAGRVDYADLKRDRGDLDAYLKRVASVSEKTFAGWDEAQRLAFLLNLYNAATLRLIIDHYPVKSIKDIGSFFRGPWKQKVVGLFGETITLSALEHDIIRKHYDEPRIHAALVCAAKSCPPLRSEAYVGERLDEQLGDQMRQFLGTRSKNRVDASSGSVYLSQIFQWYGEDFEKHGESVLDAIADYWPEREAALLKGRGKWTIVYTDYDWSLNE